MMTKNKFLTTAILMAAATMAACSDNDGNNDAPDAPAEETISSFVLATSVKDGEQTANVLLTAPSLTDGSVSAVNNGLVNDGATEWVFYGDKYLYALTYNQGNAGTTRSYVLDANGQLRARSAEYKVSLKLPQQATHAPAKTPSWLKTTSAMASM